MKDDEFAIDSFDACYHPFFLELRGRCPLARSGTNRALAVVCQEVVDIETGSADGWFLVEGGVRSRPVVLVNPRSQMAKAFGGVLVETGVGPLTYGSLDEALGLAIRLGRIWPSEDLAKAEAFASCSEAH